MSEIIESYQEEQNLDEQKVPVYSLAVVGGVYSDGLSLIFPGTTKESKKHYSYNMNCTFKKKQRVYITKDSGTYIVLFPVGNSKRGSLVTNTAISTQELDPTQNATALSLDKQAISSLSKGATPDEIVSKINELVDKLNSLIR